MDNNKAKILIIDYGFGNLFSIAKALKHLGAETIISDNPRKINEADGIILPGVGAFGDGMKGLRKKGFIKPIVDFVKSGRPLMGICLGMQFLFDHSEEFGKHKGLGLIKGTVKKIPEPKKNNDYKIPNIGWRELLIPSHRNSWRNTVFSSTKERDQVYFVHSFAGYPTEKKDVLANIKYGGKILTAAVMKNNIIGVQFHPEKSGPDGLKILNQLTNIIKKQHAQF